MAPQEKGRCFDKLSTNGRKGDADLTHDSSSPPENRQRSPSLLSCEKSSSPQTLSSKPIDSGSKYALDHHGYSKTRGDSDFGTVSLFRHPNLSGNDPSTRNCSPAKAGVQMAQRCPAWTPAFAGEQFLTCLKDICANLFQSLPRSRSGGAMVRPRLKAAQKGRSGHGC